MYVLVQNAGSPSAAYSLQIADSDGERASTLFASNQPLMFVSAAIVLLVAGLMASWWPARRANRIQPTEVIADA